MILSAFTIWQVGMTGYSSSFRAYLNSLGLTEEIKLTDSEKQRFKSEALETANKIITADKKREVYA